MKPDLLFHPVTCYAYFIGLKEKKKKKKTSLLHEQELGDAEDGHKTTGRAVDQRFFGGGGSV